MAEPKSSGPAPKALTPAQWNALIASYKGADDRRSVRHDRDDRRRDRHDRRDRW